MKAGFPVTLRDRRLSIYVPLLEPNERGRKKKLENFLCHVLVPFVATQQPNFYAFSLFFVDFQTYILRMSHSGTTANRLRRVY